MADKRQLEILMEGIEVWNEWRRRHNSESIDLSGADLIGINLSKTRLIEEEMKKAISNHPSDNEEEETVMWLPNLIASFRWMFDFDGASKADLWRGLRRGLKSISFVSSIGNDMAVRNFSSRTIQRANSFSVRVHMSRDSQILAYERLLLALDLVEEAWLEPNLSGVDLSRANLNGANLWSTPSFLE